MLVGGTVNRGSTVQRRVINYFAQIRRTDRLRQRSVGKLFSAVSRILFLPGFDNGESRHFHTVLWSKWTTNVGRSDRYLDANRTRSMHLNGQRLREIISRMLNWRNEVQRPTGSLLIRLCNVALSKIVQNADKLSLKRKRQKEILLREGREFSSRSLTILGIFRTHPPLYFGLHY